MCQDYFFVAPMFKKEFEAIDVTKSPRPEDSRNFPYLGVSKNNGTSKSSILIGFSIVNHPFWDTQFLDTSICSAPPKAKCAFQCAFQWVDTKDKVARPMFGWIKPVPWLNQGIGKDGGPRSQPRKMGNPDG